MRKNDARKWLHAILDLLPVIFIPVFMVYSHRHTIDNLQVQYAQNEVVDFNQLNDYSLIHDQSWIDAGGTCNLSNGLLHVELNNISQIRYLPICELNIVNGHKYLLKTSGFNNPQGLRFYLFESGNALFNTDEGIVLASNYTNPVYCRLYTYGDYLNVQYTFDCYINIFDLTQMFGYGNEPSVEQFNSWYLNDYYDYNLGTKELLKDYQTLTYNNTDIGSQLLYSIYTPVHDYMNFNNVFNFGVIYDWLQLNIFGGTAPMSVFIVWNIVLYEFLMDLIFLLYALFMFFIDFCTNLIDRFNTKCSGGK